MNQTMDLSGKSTNTLSDEQKLLIKRMKVQSEWLLLQRTPTSSLGQYGYYYYIGLNTKI